MVNCFCPEMTEEEFLAWDMQEYDWSGKSFYRVTVPMISHFPVAPELKVPKVVKAIKEQGLTPTTPPLILFNDGMLVGSLLVEVLPSDRNRAKIHEMKGTKVISKTFRGPRHLVPKALKEFDRSLMRSGRVTNDFYFWFLTCKHCNPKDKENKTIIFAKI